MTTPTFPLYNDLVRDIKSKELTSKERNEFLTMIEKLDENGKELFYVLVFYYFSQSKQDNLFIFPYEGTYIKHQPECVDVSWDLNKFPPKLKQILYKFLMKHMAKLAEDELICRYEEEYTSTYTPSRIPVFTHVNNQCL